MLQGRQRQQLDPIELDWIVVVVVADKRLWCCVLRKVAGFRQFDSSTPSSGIIVISDIDFDAVEQLGRHVKVLGRLRWNPMKERVMCNESLLNNLIEMN